MAISIRLRTCLYLYEIFSSSQIMFFFFKSQTKTFQRGKPLNIHIHTHYKRSLPFSTLLMIIILERNEEKCALANYFPHCRFNLIITRC